MKKIVIPKDKEETVNLDELRDNTTVFIFATGIPVGIVIRGAGGDWRCVDGNNNLVSGIYGAFADKKTAIVALISLGYDCFIAS